MDKNKDFIIGKKYFLVHKNAVKQRIPHTKIIIAKCITYEINGKGSVIPIFGINAEYKEKDYFFFENQEGALKILREF